MALCLLTSNLLGALIFLLSRISAMKDLPILILVVLVCTTAICVSDCYFYVTCIGGGFIKNYQKRLASRNLAP